MTYRINWSNDTLKAPFDVEPLEVNISASSIPIFGRGTPNYGERLQESILHILENFASNTPPAHATIGQLWYDSNNSEVKVWGGSTWSSISNENPYLIGLTGNVQDQLDGKLDLTGGTITGSLTVRDTLFVGKDTSPLSEILFYNDTGDTWRGFRWNDTLDRFEVSIANDNVYYKVWHAGNDGSGSGLDADLLDGFNSSASSAASTIVARDSSAGINAAYFNSTSLRSQKENINIFAESALEIIESTEIIGYNFINDPDKIFRIGFIADDTHEYLATINHDQFDVNNTVGLLLKAVQELSDRNKKLEKEIELLKSKG